MGPLGPEGRERCVHLEAATPRLELTPRHPWPEGEGVL